MARAGVGAYGSLPAAGPGAQEECWWRFPDVGCEEGGELLRPEVGDDLGLWILGKGRITHALPATEPDVLSGGARSRGNMGAEGDQGVDLRE